MDVLSVGFMSLMFGFILGLGSMIYVYRNNDNESQRELVQERGLEIINWRDKR